jgi:hypothetical protein
MSNTTITPLVGAASLAGVAPTLGGDIGPSPTISPTQQGDGGQGVVYTWAGLLNGSAGNPPNPRGAPYSSAFFIASGTFGSGGSVQIEGSADGVNWAKLSPAALTGAGAFASLGVQEKPKFLRPHVTAGDGTTNLTVTGYFV